MGTIAEELAEYQKRKVSGKVKLETPKESAESSQPAPEELDDNETNG